VLDYDKVITHTPLKTVDDGMAARASRIFSVAVVSHEPWGDKKP